MAQPFALLYDARLKPALEAPFGLTLPVDADDAPALVAALTRALDAGASPVLVQGDDRLLCAILAMHERALLGHATPLLCAPIDAERSRAARWLEVSAKPRDAAQAVLKAQRRGKLRRERVTPLRVMLSTSPEPLLAMTFTAGAPFDMLEASARARLGRAEALGRALGALGRGLSSEPPEALRVTLDYAPSPGALYLVASALPTGHFELAMGDTAQPRVRVGAQVAQLARDIARGRAPLGRLRGHAAPFHTIHLDAPRGVALDDQLIAPAEPCLIQLTGAPDVTLVAP